MAGGLGKESGFTLIELVMVIVIIGILATVAIPKFLDVQGSAYQAVVYGYAGDINSANYINRAACSMPTTPARINAGCAIVSDCATGATALITTPPRDSAGGTGWTYLPSVAGGTVNGAVWDCTVDDGTFAAHAPVHYRVIYQTGP